MVWMAGGCRCNLPAASVQSAIDNRRDTAPAPGQRFSPCRMTGRPLTTRKAHADQDGCSTSQPAPAARPTAAGPTPRHYQPPDIGAMTSGPAGAPKRRPGSGELHRTDRHASDRRCCKSNWLRILLWHKKQDYTRQHAKLQPMRFRGAAVNQVSRA